MRIRQADAPASAERQIRRAPRPALTLAVRALLASVPSVLIGLSAALWHGTGRAENAATSTDRR
jgi:hypothetical protein